MSAVNIVNRMTDADDQSNLCVVLRSGKAGLEAALVADEKGRWSIPGGHAKENETHADACKREVKEETGLEVEVTPLFLADHVAREIPVTLFYAIVSADAEVRPGGGDVTKVRWVSINDLGSLNGTDRLAIQVAANRVHNPQAVIDDAAEIAESQGFAVAVVSAPPAPVSGTYFRINGKAAPRYAERLSEWAVSLGWPTLVVDSKLLESTADALERAKQARKLTPVMDGLLHASDALWRYESTIAPRLAQGHVVLEIGPEIDAKRLLDRGLNEDIWNTLSASIPKPVAMFDVGDEFDPTEFQVLKDSLEQMKSVTCQKCGNAFDYANTPEASMGSVRCPACNALMDQTGKSADVDAPEPYLARLTRREIQVTGKLEFVRHNPEDHGDPIVRCPKCSHEGPLMTAFLYLAHGFNGIEPGSDDDLDAQECGNCGAKLEWKHLDAYEIPSDQVREYS